MSYDLYLFGREGKPPLERQDFLDHFQGDLFSHEGDSVHYSNGDTGVYFTFTSSRLRWSRTTSRQGVRRFRYMSSCTS